MGGLRSPENRGKISTGLHPKHNLVDAVVALA